MCLKPLATLFLIASFYCGNYCCSQISGTKSIPGDYTSIASAVNDVNSLGISGNVIFNVAMDHVETAPVGGVVMKFDPGVPVGNRTNATQGITFQRSGAGTNNPRIIAFTGLNDNNSLTAFDGIVKIVGMDYLTFFGIDLYESASNTTPTQKMEIGYGILRESVTNGSQFLNFRACNVVLDNSYNDLWINGWGAKGSVGFFSGPMTDASTAILNVSGATAGGANSNLQFWRNVVENVQTGFFIYGFDDASPYAFYDQANSVGTVMGGNDVFNFKHYGIYSKNQGTFTVLQANIDNDQNGSAATSSIYGIYNDVSVNSVYSITESIIQLVAGAYSGDCVAIYDKTSGTGSITMDQNSLTLQGGNTANLLFFSGIYRPMGFSRNTVTVTTNTFADYDVSYGVVTQYLFFGNVDNVISNMTFQSNSTAGNIDIYTVGNSATYGYFNSSASMTTGTITVSDNYIDRVSRYNPNNLSIEMITDIAGVNGNTISKTIQNNTLRRIQSNTGDMVGFRINYGQSLTQFTDNLMYNCEGATICWGVNLAGCNVSALNNTFRDNSSVVQFKGIYLSAFSYGTVSNNDIYNIAVNNTTANPGPSHGIYCENFSPSVTISKNRIYAIAIDANSTASQLSGIEIQGAAGSVSNVSNNVVAELSVNNASGPLCLYGFQVRRGVHNVYYNTVALGYGSMLNTVSANFGVAGISYNGITNSLDLRNNIVYVNAQQKGTGIVSALQRASGTSGTAPANFASTSGFNIYYAPNVANSFLYSEGTTSATVVNAYNLTNDPIFNSTNCSLYKVFMGGTREDSTATEIPPFIGSGTIINKYSLTPGATSYAESGGQLIGSVADDHTGTPRPNNVVTNRPDIGFEEFTGVKSAFLVCLLPVELVEYNATSTNSGTLLEWTTASEHNSSHFFIERSLNGVDWIVIGTVAAAGNSMELRNYSLLDREVSVGIVYYKLFQVDIDGTEYYKGIRSVNLEGDTEIVIFPNPASEMITINSLKELASIEVQDMSGREILLPNSVQFNIESLPSGKYFVICTMEDGAREVASFIKL
jgi:hypothetical protein